MDGAHAGSDLQGVAGEFSWGNGTHAEVIAQCLPRQPFHHNEGQTFVSAGVVGADNVLVCDLAGDAFFELEKTRSKSTRSARRPSARKFDGDSATNRRIECLEDGSQSADADPPAHLVSPYFGRHALLHNRKNIREASAAMTGDAGGDDSTFSQAGVRKPQQLVQPSKTQPKFNLRLQH